MNFNCSNFESVNVVSFFWPKHMNDERIKVRVRITFIGYQFLRVFILATIAAMILYSASKAP